MSATKYRVTVQNLHVLLTEDAGTWFAQGIELNYFAQGTSLEDVKKRFEDGFTATLHEHLTQNGKILLKPAPQEAWNEMLQSKGLRAEFSQVSIHHVEPVMIEYLAKAA